MRNLSFIFPDISTKIYGMVRGKIEKKKFYFITHEIFSKLKL